MQEIVYLGIVGSRRRNSESDKNLIREQLKVFLKLNKKIVLVSGGCPKGADRFAEELAKEFDLEIIIYRPDLTGCKQGWEFTKRYYERDKLIAERSNVLIACVASDRKGGTEKTIQHFKIFNSPEKLILS